MINFRSKYFIWFYWEIADFGLSKLIDPNNSELTKNVGTKYYVAPEILDDK